MQSEFRGGCSAGRTSSCIFSILTEVTEHRSDKHLSNAFVSVFWFYLFSLIVLNCDHTRPMYFSGLIDTVLIYILLCQKKVKSLRYSAKFTNFIGSRGKNLAVSSIVKAL